MGALFKDKCYADDAAAMDGYASSLSFTVSSSCAAFVMNAQGQYVCSAWQVVGDRAVKVNGVWNIERFTTGQASVFNPLSMSFASCDETAGFVDGVTIGWGIASACILAMCLKFMQRGAS